MPALPAPPAPPAPSRHIRGARAPRISCDDGGARRAGDRRRTNGSWGRSRVSDSSASKSGVDRDAEQLKALGYVSHFDRTMSKWENFSLGFTYLSPVVGVYTIFAGAFIAGGPPMCWTYILVGLGQFFFFLIFGETAELFPLSLRLSLRT